MLQTRRNQVIMVSKQDYVTLTLSEEQISKEEEIEKLIVSNLVQKHDSWILSKEST